METSQLALTPNGFIIPLNTSAKELAEQVLNTPPMREAEYLCRIDYPISGKRISADL